MSAKSRRSLILALQLDPLVEAGVSDWIPFPNRQIPKRAKQNVYDVQLICERVCYFAIHENGIRPIKENAAFLSFLREFYNILY